MSGLALTAGPAETALARFLSETEHCVLARLEKVEGSAPREQGTFMLVSENSLHGTIGGGFAEFDTVAHARTMLAEGRSEDRKTVILGPDSGQCCGGRLTVQFRMMTADLAEALLEEVRQAEQQLRPVMLFGAGHVGKALAEALAPLPFRVTVVETRPDELTGLPDSVRPVSTAIPEAELRDLGPGSAIVILTHDHALDFLIAREALTMDGLAYIGMIGSETKRATFAGQWRREGGNPAALERLVLPIGGNRVKDKRPAVIAAMVAAELLCLPPYPVIIEENA